MFEGMDLYLWVAVLGISALVIASIMKKQGTIPDDSEEKNEININEIYDAIEAAGYVHEVKQDVFYSIMDPWQRKMGHCRLYDEAAAPLNMIIDCEPIYFEYDDKKWLIELWKGQYGLTTGCEIGVYNTVGPDLKIPDIFEGTFYESAEEDDLLKMSCVLRKNEQRLFTRKATHWWLTGFKLGEFSEPWELTMEVNITLKDKTMRKAFVEGLQKIGYLDKEISISGKRVHFKFAEPRTPQPITRTAKTDALIQFKNEELCEKYQDITRPYHNFPDKVKAIHKQAPEMFDDIINIGKTRMILKMFEKIQKYLD